MSKYIFEFDTDPYSGNVNPFNPIVCLPSDLDRSSLIQITAIGAKFHSFLDIKTNKLHHCEDYYRRMLDQSTDS